MLQSLKNFDPISFLSISTTGLSEKDIEQLRNGLNSRIGEYLLLKFSEDISPEELDRIIKIKDGQKLLAELRKLVPNVDARMLDEIENFKNDYQSVHRGGAND